MWILPFVKQFVHVQCVGSEKKLHHSSRPVYSSLQAISISCKDSFYVFHGALKREIEGARERACRERTRYSNKCHLSGKCYGHNIDSNTSCSSSSKSNNSSSNTNNSISSISSKSNNNSSNNRISSNSSSSYLVQVKGDTARHAYNQRRTISLVYGEKRALIVWHSGTVAFLTLNINYN